MPDPGNQTQATKVPNASRGLDGRTDVKQPKSSGLDAAAPLEEKILRLVDRNKNERTLQAPVNTSASEAEQIAEVIWKNGGTCLIEQGTGDLAGILYLKKIRLKDGFTMEKWLQIRDANGEFEMATDAQGRSFYHNGSTLPWSYCRTITEDFGVTAELPDPSKLLQKWKVESELYNDKKKEYSCDWEPSKDKRESEEQDKVVCAACGGVMSKEALEAVKVAAHKRNTGEDPRLENYAINLDARRIRHIDASESYYKPDVFLGQTINLSGLGNNTNKQNTMLDGIAPVREIRQDAHPETARDVLNRNLKTALMNGAMETGHHHDSSDGFCTCDYCTTVSMLQDFASDEVRTERKTAVMITNAQFANAAMNEERIAIGPVKEDAVIIRFEPATQGTRTANEQKTEDTDSANKRKSKKIANRNNDQNASNTAQTKPHAVKNGQAQKDRDLIVLKTKTTKRPLMQEATKKPIKLADVIDFQTIRNRLAKPLGNNQKPVGNIPDLKDQKTRDAEERRKKKREKSAKTEDKKAKKRAKDEKDRTRKPPYSEQTAESKKKLKAKELETKKKEKARKREDIKGEFKSFKKNANEGIRKGVKQAKEADNGLLKTRPKKKLYGTKNSASKPKLDRPRPLEAQAKETKVKIKEHVKPEAKKPKHEMETTTRKSKNKTQKTLDQKLETSHSRPKTQNSRPALGAGLSTSPFATCMKQRSSYHKPKVHIPKAETETKKQQKTKQVREHHNKMIAMAEAAIRGKKAPERQVMAA